MTTLKKPASTVRMGLTRMAAGTREEAASAGDGCGLAQRIRTASPVEAAGRVADDDGADPAVVGVVCGDCAAPSEAGQGSSADGGGADVSGCTSCSTGLPWPRRHARRRCRTARRCGGLWASTWAGNGAVPGSRPGAGSARAGGGHGHDRRRPAHRGARLTRNAEQARNPERHQTRKSQHWTFGMKRHIGVDSRTGLAPSAAVTAAKVHDPGACAPGQELHSPADPQARRSGRSRARQEPHPVVDSRVGHVCAVVKRLWGFTEARYRGLARNANRRFVARGLANLDLTRARLMGSVRLPGAARYPRSPGAPQGNHGYRPEPINRRVRTGSAEPVHIGAAGSALPY